MEEGSSHFPSTQELPGVRLVRGASCWGESTPPDAHREGDELSPQEPFCWAVGLCPWPEPAMGCQGHWGHQGTALLGPGGEEKGRNVPDVLQCSVTCGVGAIWRTVRCSTGRDDSCATANKPVPARRCSLRPCSSWRVGNWSKVKAGRREGIPQKSME